MKKHTPGPWHWWDENSNPPRPKKYDLMHLIGGNGELIYGGYGGAGDKALGNSTESRANALLIVAAPDMKAALELALDALLDPIDNAAAAVAISSIRAVIARSEGKR